MMEILSGLFNIVRSANLRHLLFCFVGICGIFQLVHGRHRDVENMQYDTTGLKYDPQLSSADKSSDDGRFLIAQKNK